MSEPTSLVEIFVKGQPSYHRSGTAMAQSLTLLIVQDGEVREQMTVWTDVLPGNDVRVDVRHDIRFPDDEAHRPLGFRADAEWKPDEGDA